jgi:hypothetical protein
MAKTPTAEQRERELLEHQVHTKTHLMGRMVALLEGEQDLRKREMELREKDEHLKGEHEKFLRDKREKLFTLLLPLLPVLMPRFVESIQKLFDGKNGTFQAMSDDLKGMPIAEMNVLLGTLTDEQIENISKALFKAQIAGMDRKTLLAARSGDIGAIMGTFSFLRALDVEGIKLLVTHLEPGQAAAFVELFSRVAEREAAKSKPSA